MNDSYTAEGTIIEVGPIEKYGESFQKRVVVLEIASGDEGQYTETVPFEMCQKASHYADGVAVGTRVTMHFSLRGRLWTPKDDRPPKYFGSLNAFKMELDQDSIPQGAPPPPFPPQHTPSPSTQPGMPPPQHDAAPVETVDNIPF